VTSSFDSDSRNRDPLECRGYQSPPSNTQWAISRNQKSVRERETFGEIVHVLMTDADSLESEYDGKYL